VLARSYAYGPGIDNILAMTTYGATTNTYFYLKDAIGSVHALVNTNGAVVEQYRYTAWGEVTVLSSNGTVLAASAYGNRFTFQGREVSYSTGLLFFRSRYYSASLGRWLSKDRIGIAGGINLYQAFGANSVNFKDPDGLVVIFIHGTWSSGAEAFPNDFRQHVLNYFHDQNAMTYSWSGDNCDKERRSAGAGLAAQLMRYRRQHPNEPIRIVAHSHGGNVSLIASQTQGVTIDRLVTLGTPIMSDYQPGRGIGAWDNVYSTSDRVQTLPPGAGRTSDRANNIQLQNLGHSELHTINAWDAAFPPAR